MPKRNAIVLISCPDSRGVVAAISSFISHNNGNIFHFDQHVDEEENVFFCRIEWGLEGFAIPREEIHHALDGIAQRFRMQWGLFFTDVRSRMAIMVSKEAHCLYDILARHETDMWNADIPLILSNHEELQPIAERMQIPFHVFPITRENKVKQETREVALLKEHGVNLVVLARYMQILSGHFLAEYPQAVINIHHSFLPAFPGARPYHSAFARGVKIIGATSHYATENLDEGPIIEQDVIRVTHKQSVGDLKRMGQDLEKIVLARAITWQLEHKILVYNNKTVVFD